MMHAFTAHAFAVMHAFAMVHAFAMMASATIAHFTAWCSLHLLIVWHWLCM
jgi:hypothetical protein